MSRSRSWFLASLSAAAWACTEPKATDTSPDDSGDDTGDSQEPEPDPVWEDLRLETSDTLTGCYASGSGLFATTEQGEVWLRASGKWRNLEIDVEEESLNGMWGTGADADAVVVVVGDAGYIATLNAGSWTVEDVGTANFEAVAGPSTTDLVAVGWGGVYVNASGKWTYEPVEGNPRFNDVWYDGTTVVAVGEDGAVGRRAGGTWSVTAEGSRRRLFGVSGPSASELYAVGERGTVLHYDGADWAEVDVGEEVNLWAVYAESASRVFVVGNNGEALLYDGAAWTPLPTGVENVLYATHGVAGGSVWAVGNRGMALRYSP